jgi:putative transposase
LTPRRTLRAGSLKSSSQILRQGEQIRFAFIAQNRYRFDLKIMCRVLHVSKSGYHAWKKRPKANRTLENEQIMDNIKTIHQASRATYGSPRVQKVLEQQGIKVSRPRVARLMQDLGLKGKFYRRFKTTTNSKHSQPIANNLLERDFVATAPNEKWAGDMTYIPTLEGWLYLAVVIDLFSRKVIGWGMGERITAELATNALEMAQKARGAVAGVIYHSDRGVQYASDAFQKHLKSILAVSSMSNRGDCWDNAVVESFLGTLKLELDLHTSIGTREATKGIIFEWIEVFYNRQRLHSSIDYSAPAVFEEHWSRGHMPN